jgi:hypothetical protein
VKITNKNDEWRELALEGKFYDNMVLSSERASESISPPSSKAHRETKDDFQEMGF